MIEKYDEFIDIDKGKEDEALEKDWKRWWA
jgi:hypothetical protein